MNIIKSEVMKNEFLDNENESEDSCDSSDDDDSGISPTWQPTLSAAGIRDISFTEDSGFKMPIPGKQSSSPIDRFNLLLHVVLLEKIVTETNKMQ